MAQEDAIRINWTRSDGDYFRISSSNSNDMSRQSNGAMELTFNAKSFNNSDAIVKIGQCDNGINCDNTIDIKISGDWREYRISLSCFEKLGVDMTKVTSALLIRLSPSAQHAAISIAIPARMSGLVKTFPLNLVGPTTTTRCGSHWDHQPPARNRTIPAPPTPTVFRPTAVAR